MFALQWSLQALGIPYAIHSVADMNKQCVEIIQANFDAVRHVHADLQSQIRSSACRLHDAQSACSCHGATLGVSGTPCKPFSLQRAKRFQDGSVKSHPDFELTETHLVTWLTENCPETGFFENVRGWDVPETPADTDTPLRRHTGIRVCVCAAEHTPRNGLVGSESSRESVE